MDNSFSVLARPELPVDIKDLFSEFFNVIDLKRQSDSNKKIDLT